MSKVKNNQAIGISRWQSSRMKMILTERWSEVWEAVETRVYNSRDLISAQEGDSDAPEA